MPDTPPARPRPFVTTRRFRMDESPEYFELAKGLREAVFIQEQNVPADEEWDGYDEEAVHWLVIDVETGNAMATGRMLPYQEGCQMRPVAKIGRIAVREDVRGLHLGEYIMLDILEYSRKEGFEQAILDSQTQALGFYEKLGFEKEGDEFMEAGIPHFCMRLAL